MLNIGGNPQPATDSEMSSLGRRLISKAYPPNTSSLCLQAPSDDLIEVADNEEEERLMKLLRVENGSVLSGSMERMVLNYDLVYKCMLHYKTITSCFVLSVEKIGTCRQEITRLIFVSSIPSRYVRGPLMFCRRVPTIYGMKAKCSNIRMALEVQ